MAPRKKARLKLEPETFGQKLKRAYLTQRSLYGWTLEDIEERITSSGVMKISDTQMQRLERHTDLPPTAQTRLQAYVVIIAYGYDPADFGLTEENVPLGAIDLKKLYNLVSPKGPKPSNLRHHRPRSNPSDQRLRRSRCSEVSAA